jgi:hypothetical protein
MGPRRPKCHQHREREGGGGGCPANAGEGRDTNARQQKSEDEDATPDLLLKHPDATLYNIRLKADETIETCI